MKKIFTAWLSLIFFFNSSLSFADSSVVATSRTSGVSGQNQGEQTGRRNLFRSSVQAAIQFAKRAPDVKLYGSHPRYEKVFVKAGRSLQFLNYLSERQLQMFKSSQQAIHEQLNKNPILQSSLSGSARSSAIVIQTYFMIVATTMLALAKEQYSHSMTTGEFNAHEFTNQLGTAFDEIINSGEIFAGFLSSTLVHASMRVPLRLVQELITSSSARPIFKIFMIGLAHSLVSFVGWEFGSQLWKEATFLLDNQVESQAERELLVDRDRFWTNLSRAYFQKSSRIDPIKKEAAQKMLLRIQLNILNILFVDSELRIQWLYNTLRLRMLNGQFATSLAIMTTITSVGMTIIPGAGVIWGMVFGLAGAGVSLIVSTETKNDFTVRIKQAMARSLDEGMGEWTKIQLQSLFNKKQNDSQHFSHRLESLLIDRVSYRERYADIYIERLFTNNQIIVATSDSIAKLLPFESTRHAENREELANEIYELQHVLASRIRSSLDAMVKLVSQYATESQLLFSLKSDQLNESQMLEFESQILISENIMGHFCSFAKSYFLVLPIMSIDWLDRPSRSNLQKLKNFCDFEIPVIKRSYAQLTLNEKEEYDAAIRFLDRAHWGSFDELKTSIERYNLLTQVAN